jgi:hypothetical protein
MNLKDMIAKMDAIDAPSKKQELKESASMNISMTADDAGQVGQLMNMMRNAGMSPEKVSDKPLTPRMDMEKHMKAMGPMDDDPKIPGRDDVPRDQDLKAGLGKAALTAIGGGVGGLLAGPGGAVAGALASGAFADDAENDDTRIEGDYANSPEEEYSPHTDVIKGGNDLNKSKKSYPKVAGGDNPMALASKIKEELSTLYKEYTGKDVVEGKGSPKSKMIDVEDGMSKAEFYKEHPTASENEYDEIKQEIKDQAEENN